MYALGRELQAAICRRCGGPSRRDAGQSAVRRCVRHRFERCVPHAGTSHAATGVQVARGTDMSRRSDIYPAARSSRAPVPWRCRCWRRWFRPRRLWRRLPPRPRCAWGSSTYRTAPSWATSARSRHGQVDAERCGADFKLSPILKSLEPYKKYVTSFGNLQNQAMVGGVQVRPATWLSGHRPDKGSVGASMATTLDRSSRRTSARTRRSRRSRCRPRYAAGGGVQRLSVFLQHDALVPRRAFTLPMEFNPRKVFAMLFGEGDTPEEARRDSGPDAKPAGSHHRQHARPPARSGRERSECSTPTSRPCARSSGG